MRETLAAIRHLEEAVLGARWTEGIVLRYGVFYGPGTSLAPGEEQFEMIRKRKFPLVGDGGGVWSFIHVADAAEATVEAVEHGSRGVYNVVDDEPAPPPGTSPPPRRTGRRDASRAGPRCRDRERSSARAGCEGCPRASRGARRRKRRTPARPSREARRGHRPPRGSNARGAATGPAVRGDASPP
jgi:hypothetical protein